MKKVNPFKEERYVPVAEKYKTLKELTLKQYDKKTAKPYTKTRIILLNGAEFESTWFLHNFSRHCNNNELRREIAAIRRHEQQQQKMISSLKDIEETPLETTISYEQLAVDLTAILARNCKDINVQNALNFALLEDFDHLYRFSNLLKMEQGANAKDITKNYTEIMPGRPTIAEHRSPYEAINNFICNLSSDPFTKLITNIITAAEQQTMNYYMNIGSLHPTELGRKLYGEIAMIEEQHVSEYGSLIDPNCTWLECLVMHEYVECYLYYSCFEDETDSYIKGIYEQLYLEECGHLRKACELLKKFEGKEWQSLFPCGGDFPKLLKFEGNIDYIRDVLKNTVCITKDYEKYVNVNQLKPDSNYKKYNSKVCNNASSVPSHIVIEKYITKFGEDYRYETEPHPIKELSNRQEDNTKFAR